MSQHSEGDKGEFAAFLKERPSLVGAGLVTVVTGHVFRSDGGRLVVAPAGVRMVEFPLEAVLRFKVMDSSGIHPLVQLHVMTDGRPEVASQEAPSEPTPGVRAEGLAAAGCGLMPFIMATPRQAPAHLLDLPSDPGADRQDLSWDLEGGAFSPMMDFATEPLG
jgi:hypothetical protein